jgi:hypothetical protein
MNKATTTVASVPLTWAEDDALASVAKSLKVPKCGVLRLGFYEVLKQSEPQTVKQLIRIRLKHAVQPVVECGKSFLSLFRAKKPAPEIHAAMEASLLDREPELILPSDFNDYFKPFLK